MKESILATKNEMVDGEINLGWVIRFQKMFICFTREKRSLQTPKSWIPSPHLLCNIKIGFHPWRKMRKLQKNMREKCLVSSSCMRKWNAWVRNGLGTHFWVFSFPISKNMIFQNWWLSRIRNWPQCLSIPNALTVSTNLSLEEIWGLKWAS